jgi:type I restriction enzyme, S subunit
MKTKSVPIAWVRRWGLRLDTSPYLGGAVEARIKLESLAVKKDELQHLTKNGMAGIVNAGRIKRLWVEAPDHGTRFLSSTDILRADLSTCSLISNKAVHANPKLIIHQGWTLITRAGTVGRMAYARSDMDGMACTEDVLRVIPDTGKIRSGYLYAFLGSRFGIPLVTSGTYGAIIQHIEPEHIADLPVPRLTEAVERKAHELIERAAANRVRATELLSDAQSRFQFVLGKPSESLKESLWTSVRAKTLAARCDAFYYSPKCLWARKAFDTAQCDNLPLGNVASVFIPGIFKRLYASDPSFGCPYITGGDVFETTPASDRFLMNRVADEYQLRVAKGVILIQEAGQIGGLIGRSVLVGSHLDGFAVSNNMIRVVANDDADVGYIFTALSSEPGVILITRESAGSSIPHLDAERVRQIRIPWAHNEIRHEISRLVIDARNLRDEAINNDHQAITLIEQAIEEAA